MMKWHDEFYAFKKNGNIITYYYGKPPFSIYGLIKKPLENDNLLKAKKISIDQVRSLPDGTYGLFDLKQKSDFETKDWWKFDKVEKFVLDTANIFTGVISILPEDFSIEVHLLEKLLKILAKQPTDFILYRLWKEDKLTIGIEFKDGFICVGTVQMQIIRKSISHKLILNWIKEVV